jgi:hypothetical protein
VDQAILVMYLNGAPTGRDAGPGGGSTSSAGSDAKPRRGNACLRAALRTVGVRTASDLVEFTRRRAGRGSAACRQRVTELAGTIVRLLPAGERRDVERRLHVLSEALDHSEWLGRIENWRRSDLIEADPAKRLYIDEHGDLRRGDPRTSRAA